MNTDITQGRLFDFMPYQAKHFPQEIAIAGKHRGEWKHYSTNEVLEIGHRLSAGLLDYGIVPGDKVAMISTTNRPEWNMVDLGVLQIGAINVPIYPTITEKEYEYILNDSECRIAFVSDKALFEKLVNIKQSCPRLEEIYIFNKEPELTHWTTLLADDAQASYDKIAPFMEKVEHEALATLIYTSGTTGVPKGVMLSHKNIVSNVLASSERLPAEPGMKGLSFLPLCHIFERMLIYLYAYKGVNLYYAESLETIGDDMRDVKPHIFSAVPRLLEKVYARIVAKGEALTGVKKKLFFWAVKLAERFEYNGANGWWYEKKLGLARKLIFSKWKEALGGEVRLAACGSAALSPRLCRIFNAAEIPIMEGYGLTETSPVISVNEIDNDGFRFGCTGRPITGVQVRIAEDGEILCKGPNVMMGYYKKPEQTAKVIDEQGWFHTGDIGELVEGQFLKITDRKKEIFKTSGGKYIAPQLMENVFKQSKFIEQIIVIGENQKFPAALIVPDLEALKNKCQADSIPFSGISDLKSKDVIKIFANEVERFNEQFARWEKIKVFRLLEKEWSIEGGELTPTLKLKRKAIMSKNEALINEIFTDSNF